MLRRERAKNISAWLAAQSIDPRMIGLVSDSQERYDHGYENAQQGAKEDDACQSDERPAELGVANGSDLAKLHRTKQTDTSGDDNCGQSRLGDQSNDWRQE